MRIFWMFIITFSLSVLSPIENLGPSPLYSQSSNKSTAQNGERRNLEINSDKLRSEENGRKIIFSENVTSVWGDLEIKSDILEIYSREKKSTNVPPPSKTAAQNMDIEELIAIGNVRVKKGDRFAKGDKAHYYDKSKKIILTGKPFATVWEGPNSIKGAKMTFYLERDQFEVDERVHVILFSQN